MAKSKKDKEEVSTTTETNTVETSNTNEEKSSNNTKIAISCVVCVLLVAFAFFVYKLTEKNNRELLNDGSKYNNTNDTIGTVGNDQTEEYKDNLELQDMDEDYYYSPYSPYEEINDDSIEVKTLIKKVEFDYNDNSVEERDTNNIISNGERYSNEDYIVGELILDNGIPTTIINGKKETSSINNVSKIYMFSGGEYMHYYAFLCNDGTIYVGYPIQKYTIYSSKAPWMFVGASNFDKAEKVDSSYKYVDIKKASLGWETDDTENVGIIGIREDGTKDLVRFK